ncbi:hypothetical protein ACQRIT_000322 [Beauveria bassiana]
MPLSDLHQTSTLVICMSPPCPGSISSSSPPSSRLQVGAAARQPRSLKIPPHKGSRLPSNIPLRTIQPRQNDDASHHDHRHHPPSRLSSSADNRPVAGHIRPASSDSESSWTDTGDIGDRYDDLHDPVRLQLPDDIEAELLAAVPKHRQRPDRGSKKVRIRTPSPPRRHRSSSSHYHHIDKDAIRIPNPPPRRPTRAERCIGSIMAGRTGGLHGLTGKPLLYFTSIFVSLGVFLFGYDQGVMSGIITGPYFIDYFGHPSKAAVGTMVAILEIGAFVSSLIVGRLGDVIGRRQTILYGSCIFFVGGALQTLATTMAMMMLGRIIAGFGVGMLSTIVPVYQSEISPPHNRGKLACIEFSGNVIGYTTSVWVDYGCGFIKNNLSWRIPLLMQCVMGALLALGSLIIVESPRWLLDTDQDEEGMVVIANLYGAGDVHNPKARDEYKEIKMSVLLQRQEGERTYADMFRRYRTRVLIAMSAQALAQLNGINVISYYAPYVFESAGWVGHDAILMTGLNGITYFLSTVPPWYLVDRWGRRPILLSGAVMMTISLSLISYFIFLDVKRTPQMVVLFVMIYNAAFGYSWGPIPWLYPPEILPLSIRSKGASLSTATNWAFNWLVGEMTPILQEWIKWRLYLIHALFCVISFVVVYFTYPETCGVRLEEMDSIFGDASTVHGASSVQDESASLMRAGSPFSGADLPTLVIDEDDDENIKSQMQTSGGEDRSVGAWLNRVVRGRSESRGSGRSGLSSHGRYTPIGQQDNSARSGSGNRN